MDYLIFISVGLVGMVGIVLDNSYSKRRDRDCETFSRTKNSSRQPNSDHDRTKRVLVIERDLARLQAVQSALQNSGSLMDIHAVATEHDALDLLAVSATFSPERLPDVLIIGTGVGKQNNSYNIMRFIDNDPRFDRIRVFAMVVTATHKAEAPRHEDVIPFQQVCRCQRVGELVTSAV